MGLGRLGVLAGAGVLVGVAAGVPVESAVMAGVLGDVAVMVGVTVESALVNGVPAECVVVAGVPAESVVVTGVLVEKGHLRIAQDGPRYDYWPVVSAEAARRSELSHVLRTFFGGSVESALATLLDVKPGGLDDAERRRLKRLIDEAAREGR